MATCPIIITEGIDTVFGGCFLHPVALGLSDPAGAADHLEWEVVAPQAPAFVVRSVHSAVLSVLQKAVAGAAGGAWPSGRDAYLTAKAELAADAPQRAGCSAWLAPCARCCVEAAAIVAAWIGRSSAVESQADSQSLGAARQPAAG